MCCLQSTSVEGLSFGQAAGLKDDLDVDDNDVGEKKRQAFLDLLMEAGQNGSILTDEEVKEQVDTIMFEVGMRSRYFGGPFSFRHSSSQGHDTTAAASSFFLSMMGCHPDIQEKVIQELDDIFGDSDRPATFQDTLEMKYLERCLMETLRMYPPVPIIARKINTDLKLGEFSRTLARDYNSRVVENLSAREIGVTPSCDFFNGVDLRAANVCKCYNIIYYDV